MNLPSQLFAYMILSDLATNRIVERKIANVLFCLFRLTLGEEQLRKPSQYRYPALRERQTQILSNTIRRHLSI